jgi:ABC-type multidrug transport system ATPase subunit
VQQFDFHLPSLTVRETLVFHANMRLPQGMEEHKRLTRVQQVR